MHVLLVEDDDSLGEALERLITSYGHTVESCANYESAATLLTASRTRFDRVITDMQLPDGTGRDILFILGGNGRDVPTLLMSGNETYDGYHLRDIGATYPFASFVLKSGDFLKSIADFVNQTN